MAVSPRTLGLPLSSQQRKQRERRRSRPAHVSAESCYHAGPAKLAYGVTQQKRSTWSTHPPEPMLRAAATGSWQGTRSSARKLLSPSGGQWWPFPGDSLPLGALGG